MGACDGIYLYSDLDGTLFTDDKRIGAEDAGAIREFVRAGGRFGIATGRVPCIIGSVSRALPVNAPCILYNGAGLYHLTDRRFLAMHPIDREDCRRIAEKAILLDSHVCVQIFTDDAIYEINPSQRDDPASILEQIPIVKLPFDEVPGTFLKFILAHTPEHLDKLIDNLDLPRICGGLSSFKSSDVYIEFVAAGVSKGKALSDVRKRCKDAKKILAIGDYSRGCRRRAVQRHCARAACGKRRSPRRQQPRGHRPVS
jgi:hydroxymethylpyrimidine pyrophosphatase-like HAD family hydrolase